MFAKFIKTKITNFRNGSAPENFSNDETFVAKNSTKSFQHLFSFDKSYSLKRTLKN